MRLKDIVDNEKYLLFKLVKIKKWKFFEIAAKYSMS